MLFHKNVYYLFNFLKGVKNLKNSTSTEKTTINTYKNLYFETKKIPTIYHYPVHLQTILNQLEANIDKE